MMTAPVVEAAHVALEAAARELSERHTAVGARAQPLDTLQHVAALAAWLDRARVLLAAAAPEVRARALAKRPSP